MLDGCGLPVYSSALRIFLPLKEKRQLTMTAITDPRDIIDNSKMTMLQIVVVALTVFLNALDGFDVLVISVSANGIAEDFGISRAALGFVLSAELAGMAVGSVLLGGVADKRGRRFTLLLCLVVMALGMFLTTTVNDAVMLCVWRVFTGLGIGGMLSSTNAVVAEFSSKKRRALCISLMVIGYPLGGIIVSYVATLVLADGTWRQLFTLGAVVTTALIPVIYFLVPESVHWLARTQPENALERVNRSLKQLGHSLVSALPGLDNGETKKTSLMDIFSPALRRITIVLTLAYFFHIVTFYFILKWTPIIVSDFMGLPGFLAPTVLFWVNVGGALGGLTYGLLAGRIGLKPLSIVLLALTTVAVVMFGRMDTATDDLTNMKMLAAFAGFFGNAGISGLYSLVAYSFPSHVRATGTGFVIGMGRGGAFMSPIFAGFLFEWQFSLPTIGLVMGIGSLFGAITLCFLKFRQDSSDTEEVVV